MEIVVGTSFDGGSKNNFSNYNSILFRGFSRLFGLLINHVVLSTWFYAQVQKSSVQKFSNF